VLTADKDTDDGTRREGRDIAGGAGDGSCFLEEVRIGMSDQSQAAEGLRQLSSMSMMEGLNELGIYNGR
jgi:hypothetical protein